MFTSPTHLTFSSVLARTSGLLSFSPQISRREHGLVSACSLPSRLTAVECGPWEDNGTAFMLLSSRREKLT